MIWEQHGFCVPVVGAAASGRNLAFNSRLLQWNEPGLDGVRRMRERRKAKRVPANLTVRWTGVTSQAGPLGKNTADQLHEGKIVDLSTDGCFVLTASHIPVNKLSLVTQVSKEEPIMLDIFLSEDKPLQLRGQVVYRVAPVGFGVDFLNLTLPDKEALRAFIEEQELGSLHSRPFPRV